MYILFVTKRAHLILEPGAVLRQHLHVEREIVAVLAQLLKPGPRRLSEGMHGADEDMLPPREGWTY